jgi:spore germination protein GerM
VKRIVSACILLSLTFSLAGCQTPGDRNIALYYCRTPDEYRYFQEDSVICAEYRDIPDHSNDLRYVIGLYLAGPIGEGLYSPLPKNVTLLSAESNPETVILTFSNLGNSLTDSEFTIACACLTLTCSDLTGCDEVTVIAGARTVTMHRDRIHLSDTILSHEITEGATS